MPSRGNERPLRPAGFATGDPRRRPRRQVPAGRQAGEWIGRPSSGQPGSPSRSRTASAPAIRTTAVSVSGCPRRSRPTVRATPSGTTGTASPPSSDRRPPGRRHRIGGAVRRRTGCSAGPSRRSRRPRSSALADVRVGNHGVGDQVQELVVRGDEGADGPGSRRKGVELVTRQPVGFVGADEVRKVRTELRDDGRVDRVVDARPHVDVDALNRRCQLDGIVMTTSPPISSDQW